MFERYTEKARRVVFFARFEAAQAGSPTIESEHLLLGILREAPGLFVSADGASKASYLRAAMHELPASTKPTPLAVDLPLSADSKLVIASAVEEAERLGDRHIGPEHLLMALFRQEKSAAARFLREAGITLHDLRLTAAARALHGGSAAADSVTTALEQVFRAMAALWNEQDRYGLANLFAVTAELIDVSGGVWKGSDRISRAVHAFDRLGIEFVSIKMQEHSQQLIGERFALSRVKWDVELRQSGRKVGSVITTVVAENLNGEWKIVLAHNTRIED